MCVCACSSRVVLLGGQGGPYLTQGLLPSPQVSWFALVSLYTSLLQQHKLCRVLVCAGGGKPTTRTGDSQQSVAVSVFGGCSFSPSPFL